MTVPRPASEHAREKTPADWTAPLYTVTCGACGTSVTGIASLEGVTAVMEAHAPFCSAPAPDAARLTEALNVLELLDGEDIRVNGCACTTQFRCYLHTHDVPKAIAALRLAAAGAAREDTP